MKRDRSALLWQNSASARALATSQGDIMSKFIIVLTFCPILFIFACAPAPEQAVDTTAEEPLVDLAAAEKAIRELDRKWFEAENNKDIEVVMSVLAEGIVWQPAIKPQIVGLEAVRELYENELFPMFVSVSGGATKVEVAASGDFAYELAVTHTVFETEDGRSEHDGRSIVIWKKIDGEWKAIVFSHILQ